MESVKWRAFTAVLFSGLLLFFFLVRWMMETTIIRKILILIWGYDKANVFSQMLLLEFKVYTTILN